MEAVGETRINSGAKQNAKILVLRKKVLENRFYDGQVTMALVHKNM